MKQDGHREVDSARSQIDDGGQRHLKSESTINLVFRGSSGISNWEQQRKSNQLPNFWPYGLDHLSRSFQHLNAIDLVEQSKSRAVVSALKSILFSNRRPGIAICWDERVAVRMLYQAPFNEMFSGLIWANDDILREGFTFKNRLMRASLRQLSGVWCLSRAQIKPTIEWLGFEPRRVHHIIFGVDSDFFRYQEPASGPPMIFSCGNDRDRDPKTLFAALDLVRKERPHVRAIVQTNTNLKPPPNVQVIGRISHSELRDMYKEAALVMVATRPNLHVSGMTVALEAMSTGRPVVISDTAGMEDYVDSKFSEQRCKPGDADGLAAAAINLIDNEELRRAVGILGRQDVERTYNTVAMADRIASVVLKGSAEDKTSTTNVRFEPGISGPTRPRKERSK